MGTTAVLSSPSPLEEKDAKWLRFLDGNLWKKIPPSDEGYGAWFEKRELTDQEWIGIIGLIRRHSLPCVLGSGPYGALWIEIYVHPEALGVAPERICSVGEGNLHGFSKYRGYAETFRVAWKAFSTFTHSARNKSMLKLYNLEPSREKDRYRY